MLSDFAEKNETFSILKTRIFQSPENRIFSKWYNTGLRSKKCQILPYLHLVIIRLETMLSDFAERKDICFDYKKNRIFHSPKTPLFQSG